MSIDLGTNMDLAADTKLTRKGRIASAKSIADALSQPVRIKTWSLIVTVFGDAIMPRGGQVYASDLNAIMEEMGVNSGAVRTALSRLANDRIITRERDGRSSIYRLAEARENEFRDAALKIYARPDGRREKTDFVLVSAGAQAGDLPNPKAIRLSREWWLVDRALPGEAFAPDMAVFEGRFTQLPQWLIDRVASPETASAMRQLNAVFEPVLAALESGSPISPLQALALRCLLIHFWRRIALRLRALPEGFKQVDWPESESRILVARLYGILSVEAESWLDGAIASRSRPPERFI